MLRRMRVLTATARLAAFPNRRAWSPALHQPPTPSASWTAPPPAGPCELDDGHSVSGGDVRPYRDGLRLQDIACPSPRSGVLNADNATGPGLEVASADDRLC